MSVAIFSGDSSNRIWTVKQPGTNSSANCSLLASTSVMSRGQAPEARAAANAINPMGPAPQITADSPSLMGLRSNACSTTLNGWRSAPSREGHRFGDLVKAARVVHMIPANGTVVWWRAGESDVGTEIV